jgi:hypothetical protein
MESRIERARRCLQLITAQPSVLMLRRRALQTISGFFNVPSRHRIR